MARPTNPRIYVGEPSGLIVSVEIFTDTIVAPITAPIRAPVAWIRVSGPDAWKIARSVFRRKGADVPEEDYRPRYAYYGEIFSGSEIIDEGLLILFEEGKSYTGESSFELSCHGSPAIVRKIVEAILQAGARPARPGEFTERAFVNGRIDLTRAEAVRETVEAVTEAQLRRARLLREGRLAERVEAWEEAVAKELARAEASVDFSEEIGELNREAVAENLRRVLGGIEEVLHTYPSARLLREGLRVAIVGRTNVGKSSLLNALLGTERAIVTDIPGTTRDTIEETLSVKGFPVVLTDTAGIRETEDRVESLGVMRSKKAVETADQVWFVYEAPLGWTPED
ncbi:MAG: tRNA uridine-5-carboxymethylaminomethyl(34) synthesis GTPase MnmE, partial [Fimbriimonadales bacterium]|nr:tRNA uridine-5-carboxymethylaminomethyl(34) synthesis GTPase MnmE [Fimbriimonadales bacterium]